MDDEDEIDVLGEFNLENLLTKNEERMSSCYDGEPQLGLNCDSSWMLDSTQSCWYDSKSDPQPALEEFSTINSTEANDNNAWSDKERYLLEKGLELFGRSYSRLAQYIGSKTSSQVKSYMICHKPMEFGWSGKSSVSTSSVGADVLNLNFTEIIDDMEIPASMEEVIAVVSTAQPTVIVPSSHRDSNSVHRKKCRKRKHSRSGSKRNHIQVPNLEGASLVFNAEDIKGVLTDNKEQDSIVLPSGEQVIRMRYGSSLSEESEVDIDANSEPDAKESKEALIENEDSQPLTGETIDPQMESSEEIKEEFFEFQEESIVDFSEIQDERFVPHIEKEVSVVTEGYIEQKTQPNNVEKDTQVYKGSLITPSGKVMTVVVDDLSISHCTAANVMPTPSPPPPPPPPLTHCTADQHDRLLDAVYELPLPTHESIVHPHIVTREEQQFHPEFFDVNFSGLSRYLKIRNLFIECWKNSKPNHVPNTSVQISADITRQNYHDVKLINRIHTYLERKGYINFGCEECHYNQTAGKSNVLLEDFSDQVCSIVEVDSSSSPATETVIAEYTVPIAEYTVPVKEYKLQGIQYHVSKEEKKGSSRVRKKKKAFEETCEKTIRKYTPRAKKPGSKTKKSKVQTSRLSPLWRPHKRINNNCEDEEEYTMMHMDMGKMIHNQIRQPNKMLTRGIRPVRLIHCKNYSVMKKAPYKVELEVLVLLLVDIHSHLSPKCEVIGLLGGIHRSSDNVLMITMAVPCKTVLSSNIHCDMCPVSQCESSEMITSQGLAVVGWYHSHPNFDPSPSDTDVDTQNTLQSWFNDSGQPFVGLIISPYFPAHDVSFYRCCQVETESKGPVPYQLEVKLINLYGNNGLSLKQPIEAAFKTLQAYEPIRQLNVYKCLESVKHHLRKAVPKVEEEKVSQVVKEIRECIREGFSSIARK